MTIGLLEKRNENPKELERVLGGLASEIHSRCKPLEVRVFGSAARGERRVGSDIDICVIFENADHLARGRAALFERPLIEEPLDLVLLSKDEYDRLKDVGGISFEVCHHGRRLDGGNL